RFDLQSEPELGRLKGHAIRWIINEPGIRVLEILFGHNVARVVQPVKSLGPVSGREPGVSVGNNKGVIGAGYSGYDLRSYHSAICFRSWRWRKHGRRLDILSHGHLKHAGAEQDGACDIKTWKAIHHKRITDSRLLIIKSEIKNQKSEIGLHLPDIYNSDI
ncbi:MAG: hypothetical protein L6437_13535, partial [Kiritimatiellae bacterium]|nr:hypothetical protein [Kiritimatiellia bacterium]